MGAPLLTLATGIALALCGSDAVLISNASPRYDTSGKIMDAHDGKTFYHNETKLYYQFAASYGLCQEPTGDSGCSHDKPGDCGFRADHNMSLWTSPDLAAWTPFGPVLQMSNITSQMGIQSGILFCPKVLYNSQTKQWVAWFNYLQDGVFSLSFYASATAPTPTGPWMISNPNITMKNPDTGDFDLFQDDDGAAYVIYTSLITQPNVNHRMSVEKLTDDYTGSTMQNSGFFGASKTEAPTMFKRGPTYYALFGSCCCYCKSGSAVTAHTASNPLGPWLTLGPVDAGGPAASGIHAQQTNMVKYFDGTGVAAYMWQGDGWQQAPDGIKGHDPLLQFPVSFAAAGNMSAMQYVDSFSITVSTP